MNSTQYPMHLCKQTQVFRFNSIFFLLFLNFYYVYNAFFLLFSPIFPFFCSNLLYSFSFESERDRNITIRCVSNILNICYITTLTIKKENL